MDETLARIERDIAQAVNAGDLTRARQLSEQWHRLWLLERAKWNG
jgi:hypothetical protein